MKRIGLVIICAIMIVSVSGCSKKQILECKKSSDQGGVKIEQTMVFNFKKNNEIKDAKIEQNIVLGKESLEIMSLKDYKELLSEEWEKTEYADLKYKVTDNGKDTINFSVTMNTKEAEKMYGKNNSKQAIKELKKEIEKNSYKCSIK